MGRKRKAKRKTKGVDAFGVIDMAARWISAAIVLFLIGSIAWVILYRFVAPPTTYLMTTTRWSGETVSQDWVPLEAISPLLWQTAIGAEDMRFCEHFGIDFKAIDEAIEEHAKNGDRLRGASTISQQTAKNAFLWPGRNFVRKGLEAYFTLLIELLWPKRRIMEVYLNIAEFGPGVFGVQAASTRYLGKAPRDVTPREAGLLMAVLPSPKRMSAARPSSYVQVRAAQLEYRASLVRRDHLASCMTR